MYKKYYSRFLTANPHIQHYTVNGHHYFLDVSREATLQCWDDSIKLIDDKYNYVLEEKISSTQKLIAEILNLSHPEQLFFAPNTDELFYRILRSFPPNKKIRILTSDSEVINFDLLTNLIGENLSIEVEKISTQPFDNFEDRFISKIVNSHFDLIFISQVFFNSGMALKNLKVFVESVQNPETVIVIDGYHGFMALPTDLQSIENRIFYLVGFNKGCSFMAVPKNSKYRFTEYTMDFNALYRFEAVLKLYKNEGLLVSEIHSHVQFLQKNFRNHLLEIDHHYLTEKNILNVNYSHHGHFLTFAMPSLEHAKKMHDDLRSINIWTNYVGSRLRFGFGLYQNDCIDMSGLIKKS